MIELLISGGPVMIPIGIASVVGLAVFLERMVALRGAAVIPPMLAREVEELLRQGTARRCVAAARSSAAARVTRLLWMQSTVSSQVKKLRRPMRPQNSSGSVQYSELSPASPHCLGCWAQSGA